MMNRNLVITCECIIEVVSLTSSLMMVALLKERSAVVIFRPKSARTILKR